MSTTKISVSIDDVDLAWLKRRAKRVHGGNLSAAITEAARAIRKQEALKAFLADSGVPELTPAEIDVIRAEWSGHNAPPKARSPRRRRAS